MLVIICKYVIKPKGFHKITWENLGPPVRDDW